MLAVYTERRLCGVFYRFALVFLRGFKELAVLAGSTS